MPKTSLRIPSYRRHKATGQAVVTIGGRDIYLGKYNSAASRQEYNRLIAEFTSHGGNLPTSNGDDFTVAELLAAFLRHAEQYYRDPQGKQTSEVKNYKLAIRRVKSLYSRTAVKDFGPLALKAVRQGMIDADLARKHINSQVNRIRHIFKWGVENELVPSAIFHGLQAVAGLRIGRSEARESKPVKPVKSVFVDAVLPYVAPPVAAMIELQRITGMRSGEVTSMRGCDMDTSGKVWIYSPATHKTAWHGHSRQIYLGPKAQRFVLPFLKANVEAYLFSPSEAAAWRSEQRFGVVSAERKTPVYPSELKARQKRYEARRRGAGQKARRPSGRYDTIAYRNAIAYGINAANKALLKAADADGMNTDKVQLVPHWHPHQLRHNAATGLRREHGIEVARIILGHRSAAITEVYAEVDHARAIEVMAKIG